MRLRINIAVSLFALTTIVWGVRFAIAQEHRRTPEFLQNEYQEVNRTFFDNSLPLVRIEWADLRQEKYKGETYQQNDGTFVVLVDRSTNFREAELSQNVRHEMCHLATWRQEEDPHGPAFQACMERINN